jgi:hypothetical protein
LCLWTHIESYAMCDKKMWIKWIRRPTHGFASKVNINYVIFPQRKQTVDWLLSFDQIIVHHRSTWNMIGYVNDKLWTFLAPVLGQRVWRVEVIWQVSYLTSFQEVCGLFWMHEICEWCNVDEGKNRAWMKEIDTFDLCCPESEECKNDEV